MSTVISKVGRMPKLQRRTHLLDTAAEIVRTEGTEALTLARLAQQCSLTKPVAYQHFGTRSGLLIALYHQLGERHTNTVTAALQELESKVDIFDFFKIMSQSFVDCVLENGAVYSAISAALAATEEMGDFRQTIREELINHYLTLISPYLRQSTRNHRLLLIGFLGAAESLSEAAARKTITRSEAIETLSAIARFSLLPDNK